MGHIERLEVNQENPYSAIEAAIHVGRYQIVKEICKNKRVLDLACGEGYGSYLLAEHWGAKEVVGVDISNEAIEVASKNFKTNRTKFILSDVKDVLPLFEENSFDLIVSFETIEHISDPNILLVSLNRLIKDDGVIIISCPNDNWYYPNDETCNPYHTKKYSFEEFKTTCESVLGEAQKYMYGLPVSGFSNIDVNSKAINNNNKSMNSMFEIKDSISVMLPSEVKPSENNCSYFVGVWSKQSLDELNDSSTVYSTSMDHTDYMTVQAFKQENAKLNDHISALKREVEQLHDLLEQKEAEIKEIKKENEKNSISVKGTIRENEFLRHNLWLQQKSIDSFKRENEQVRVEINGLLNSSSWRITSPLRKVKNILRK